MANSYQLETLRQAVAANRLRIATLISNLSRTVDLLTGDIEREEERAEVRDVSDPTYPVLARNLRERRDNIRVTIGSLETLIGGADRRASPSSGMDYVLEVRPVPIAKRFRLNGMSLRRSRADIAQREPLP